MRSKLSGRRDNAGTPPVCTSKPIERRLSGTMDGHGTATSPDFPGYTIQYDGSGTWTGLMLIDWAAGKWSLTADTWTASGTCTITGLPPAPQTAWTGNGTKLAVGGDLNIPQFGGTGTMDGTFTVTAPPVSATGSGDWTGTVQ